MNTIRSCIGPRTPANAFFRIDAGMGVVSVAAAAIDAGSQSRVGVLALPGRECCLATWLPGDELTPCLVCIAAIVVLLILYAIKTRHAKQAMEKLAADLARVNQELTVQKYALDEHAIVAITDARGTITYANDNFCKISKYTREELLGQNHRILNSGHHPRDFFARMWKTIAGGEVWKGEIKNRAKDGSHYWVQATIVPVLGDDGRPSRYVAIRADITERKRAEQEIQHHLARLETANSELSVAKASIEEIAANLEQSNKELEEFAYIASHDLQEPLRKLISFGKLLPLDVGGDLPEKAAQDVAFMTDAATRMQTLVQDLLQLSRTGRNEMRLAQVNLDDCIERATQALVGRIEETQAEITRDELPVVLGDATLLTQLYQNLIGNALKFQRPGERPDIRLTAERAGDGWRLGVRDNGLGIKPEYAEMIFTPFKRLHGRGEYEGAGIGLAICRKVVERHGGRIWVESEPGRGSHFRFTMPCKQESKSWNDEAANQPLFC